jgi:hypothetical protein
MVRAWHLSIDYDSVRLDQGLPITNPGRLDVLKDSIQGIFWMKVACRNSTRHGD